MITIITITTYFTLQDSCTQKEISSIAPSSSPAHNLKNTAPSSAAAFLRASERAAQKEHQGGGEGEFHHGSIGNVKGEDFMRFTWQGRRGRSGGRKGGIEWRKGEEGMKGRNKKGKKGKGMEKVME